MAGKKPRFSLEEHKAAGQELERIRSYLLSLSVAVGRAYPKQSKETKAADKALDAVDELRCQMDIAVHAENPRAKRKEEINLIRFYYPQEPR